MPYYGIGFYSANFFDKKDLGLPFALYLFQGATVRRFNPKWALNYEWNLGMSFNWDPYDPFDNPNNVACGFFRQCVCGRQYVHEILHQRSL